MSESGKTIHEAGPDTKLIVARLARAEIGETVTYKELSALVRYDVTKKRGPLDTARDAVRREHRMVFGAVMGVGVKRLTDEELVSVGSDAMDRIRRTAKRASKKMECVANIDLMPAEKKTEFLARASCLGAIAHASRDVTVKRIAADVQKSQKRLPLEETLAAFK